jgi:hypothetical protein
MDRALRAGLAAVLMAISAPSQAQPPGLAAFKASNAYIDCLVRTARKLDDGHSAVAAIGRSVQDRCLAEQHSWEQAQTANYTADGKRAFLEGMKVHTEALAIQTVTEVRKLKL